MKAKQVIGIIVASVVILVVGVTGILGNVVVRMLFGNEQEAGFWDSFMSMEATYGEPLPTEEFVAVIDVVGEIGPTTTDMWMSGNVYNHNRIMQYVDQLKYAENNQGIMLYIDSPGGTVYESDELYLKLMEYKEETGRPIWAYFGSQACSGGYYVAMAADKIYANRNGWTGSIGVIISLLNCEGLYEKLGIEEINVASGANKAMGSAGEELTEEQREILQSLVDESYDQFVGIVSKGRNMKEDKVRELADGRLYSALQAKENKLIDEVGQYEECQMAFVSEESLGDEVLFYELESENSPFMSLFASIVSKIKPQSDAEIATDILESERNGVLMYYAE